MAAEDTKVEAREIAAKRFKRWLGVLLGIGTLIFVAGLALPQFSCSPEPAYITGSLSKGHQLVVAMRIYAEDHAGKFPDNLQELVEIGFVEKKTLTIDLKDGREPLRWNYRGGMTLDTPFGEWVLLSPPLSNDAGEFKRWLYRVLGRPQLPQQHAIRILARNDGSAEVLSEAKYRIWMEQEGGVNERPTGR